MQHTHNITFNGSLEKFEKFSSISIMMRQLYKPHPQKRVAQGQKPEEH